MECSSAVEPPGEDSPSSSLCVYSPSTSATRSSTTSGATSVCWPSPSSLSLSSPTSECFKEERRTRRHGVTLAKKQCRLDIKTFSFSQRTVNEWNRLSADCVGASSVNIFKNKIDIYLRRAGYTQIDRLDSLGFLVHLPSRVESLGGNLVKQSVVCVCVCVFVCVCVRACVRVRVRVFIYPFGIT